MYNRIKNPLTNRYVNINSILGRNILNNYINILNGGDPLSLPRSTRAKNNWKYLKNEVLDKTKPKYSKLKNRYYNNNNVTNNTNNDLIGGRPLLETESNIKKNNDNLMKSKSTKAKSNWKYLKNRVLDKTKPKYSKRKPLGTYY